MTDTDTITVFVKLVVGKSIAIQLPRDAPVQLLAQRVHEKEGITIDKMRLVYCASTLEINDSKKTLRDYNIQHNSTVTMLFRLLGGGFVDKETLRAILAIDLDDVVKRASNWFRATCPMCLEENQMCVRIHSCGDAIACAPCVKLYVQSCRFEPTCPYCSARVPLEDIFPNCGIEGVSAELREVTDLLSHIDVQMCECGALAVNETCYSKQTCEACRRDFCFFCNEDWSAEKKGQKYSCGPNCYYETQLAFELQRLERYRQEAEVWLPGTRVCPECGVAGAYAGKCKYHMCACGHQFCFICLQSEVKCKAGGSNYGKQCVAREDIRRQTFTDFKHMIPPRRK